MKPFLLAFTFLLMTTPAIAGSMSIDGSSKETFDNSLKEMADGLTPDEKTILGKGVVSLIFRRYAEQQGLAQGAFSPKAMEYAPKTMNGVTFDEIMAAGKEVQATAAAVAQTSLDETCVREKVLITKASIVHGDWGPSVHITVTNTLKWPISFVIVQYKVTSRGRAVPWSKETFGMSITGGIEPGESRSIDTTASVPQEAPKDLQVEAHIQDVADAESRQLVGKQMYSGNSHQLTPFACE